MLYMHGPSQNVARSLQGGVVTMQNVTFLTVTLLYDMDVTRSEADVSFTSYKSKNTPPPFLIPSMLT